MRGRHSIVMGTLFAGPGGHCEEASEGSGQHAARVSRCEMSAEKCDIAGRDRAHAAHSTLSVRLDALHIEKGCAEQFRMQDSRELATEPVRILTSPNHSKSCIA